MRLMKAAYSSLAPLIGLVIALVQYCQSMLPLRKVNGQSQPLIKVNTGQWSGQQSVMMTLADMAGDISRWMDDDMVMITSTRADVVVMTSTRIEVGVWGAAFLGCAWGHVQAPMTTRLPRLSRSRRSDHCGTYKKLIRARYTVKTVSVVVYVVRDSLTMIAAGLEPKDNGWETSEVQ